MKLSIIIINYNTRTLLQTCLRSVFDQTQKLDFEVIVVDNGSSDGSRDMLAQDFPQVRTIFNEDNRGFAAANNQGIRIAQGELILLLNSDTEILDRAIEKAVAFVDAQPQAGIAGCKLLNSDGSLQHSCRSFPSPWHLFTEAFFLYLLFSRTKLFGGYHMSCFAYDKVERVDVVMGAFMLIRREVFETAGLLDESYFMYTEETDFCYRARERDFNVFFTPDAQVVHHVAASKESTYSYLEQVHLSQIQFIQKHFHGLKKLLCILLKKVGIALRVPVYFLFGLLTFNRAHVMKSRHYFAILVRSFL